MQGDGAGEFERGVGLAVGGGRFPGSEDFIGGQAGLAAEQGVGAEAVAAAVDLGDGEGDLFAELRGEHAAGEGAAEVEVAFQRGGGIAEHAHQVRHEAELALDGGEELLGLAGGGGGIGLMDAVHLVWLVVWFESIRSTCLSITRGVPSA